MSVGSVCAVGLDIAFAGSWCGLSVELGGQRREWGAREHRRHGQPEDVAYPECQIEAGKLIAPFQCTDGLRVDVHQLRELRPSHPPLSAQDADAVVDGEGFPSPHRTHTTYCLENPTTCQVTATTKHNAARAPRGHAPRCDS